MYDKKGGSIMKRYTQVLAAGFVALLVMQWGGVSYAFFGQKYEVTITNVTRGQVITPPVVISHDKRFQLFELGAPAIDELVELAEEGATEPLLDYVATLPSVWDSVAAPTPLMPGESTTVEIFLHGKFRYITAVGMLADTNDAFFSVRKVRPLRTKMELVVFGDAYDAGSEGNSELCEHIPGPACGSHGVRNTDGAEGFVHVHAGIHGIGDLAPDTYDWRNPVAEIVIRRAH
jgi:hypothetical protein